MVDALAWGPHFSWGTCFLPFVHQGFGNSPFLSPSSPSQALMKFLLLMAKPQAHPKL